MISVSVLNEVGSFAEDKDTAAKLRETVILPTIKRNEEITLDFKDVTLVTQSFIHALIAQALREKGDLSLSLIHFQNCSPVAKGIIETVVQYVLESMDEDDGVSGSN